MDRKLTNTVLKCRVDKIKREYLVILCPRENIVILCPIFHLMERVDFLPRPKLPRTSLVHFPMVSEASP